MNKKELYIEKKYIFILYIEMFFFTFKKKKKNRAITFKHSMESIYQDHQS